MKLRLTRAAWPLCTLLALVVARPVHAFCGFYVNGADSSLTNDATLVVLMRDGTRTVLSMQNTYTGPPQDFALVIPVPVVLRAGRRQPTFTQPVGTLDCDRQGPDRTRPPQTQP